MIAQYTISANVKAMKPFMDVAFLFRHHPERSLTGCYQEIITTGHFGDFEPGSNLQHGQFAI
jgi:hypothetical protein